jgi:hypothetical protein
MHSGAMPNDNGGVPNQTSEPSRSAFAIAFVSVAQAAPLLDSMALATPKLFGSLKLNALSWTAPLE